MARRCTGRKMMGGQEHEHISALSWVDDETKATGTSSIASLIDFVETNSPGALYCLADDGRRKAPVAVVKGKQRPYLRTYADNVWTNNLLSLPLFF